MDAIRKEIQRIERRQRDNNLVVLCSGCDGYLLKEFAVERRGFRWEDAKGKHSIVKSFFCQDCETKLKGGLVLKEDY